MLEKLSYISLAVEDVPAAEKFYREKLGFKVQYRGKDSCRSCIEMGEYNLILEAAGNGTGPRPGQVTFGFEVDTRERFDREVRAVTIKGASLLQGPEEDGDGNVRVVFRGADGERIVITGPTEYDES